MRKNKPISSQKSRKLYLIEDATKPGRIRTASFAQAYPEIAALWDFKKNCGFGPEDFAYGSRVHAWFKCPRGKDHKFRAPITSMSTAGKTKVWSTGCGFCRGLKASVTNNLAVKFPHLAKEWMVSKNGYKPDQISSGSSKKAWWKGKCGHIWLTAISNRTSYGTGCPKCNVGSPIDLRDYPEALAEFDHKKNKGIDPYVLPTHGTFYWRCSVFPAHTWVAGFARTTKQTRCPYCTNQKGSKENNLKKSHPTLAKQWHLSRNKDRKPADFTSGSNYRAWWCCPKGPDHEWQARIAARAKSNSRCPFCLFRLTSITNVISTAAPHLVPEWHPTRNGKVKPSNERIHSATKRWWLCSKCSHEWQVQPQRRVLLGSGCPQCAKMKNSKKRPSQWLTSRIQSDTI
jgi:hypothetical protein